MREIRNSIGRILIRAFFLFWLIALGVFLVDEFKDWKTEREIKKDLKIRSKEPVNNTTRGIHIKSDTLKK